MSPHVQPSVSGTALAAGVSGPVIDASQPVSGKALAAGSSSPRRTSNHRRLAPCRSLVFFALLLLPAPCFAQAWWQIPPDPVKVDLTAKNAQRRITFDAQGMGVEIVVPIVLIRRAQVTIAAELGEAGRFDAQLVGAGAKAEIKNIRTEGAKGQADLVSQIFPLSPDEALKQSQASVRALLEPERIKGLAEAKKQSNGAIRDYLRDRGANAAVKDDQLRDAFARAWSIEKSAPALFEKLSGLVEKHARWIPPKERADWPKADGRDLMPLYTDLLAFDLADDHLRRYGLEFDSNSTGYKRILEPRLVAVHLVHSGRVADKPEEGKLVADGLPSTELLALRQALTANVACRFYPEVDPQDPNAQWFNGQRIACRATGVSTVRVEGKLDPGKNDRIDWWILDRYKPGVTVLEAPPQSDLRIDPPFVDDNGARLRVVATGTAPVSYSFEFRLSDAPAAGVKVVVHESPASTSLKFPY